MRKCQLQQVAITRRRQAKDRDISEFGVGAFEDTNCTRLEKKTPVHKPSSSAGDATDKGHARWLHHPERFTDSDSDAHVFPKSNIRGMEPFI